MQLCTVMCLIASNNFVEIVRYLINTVHWLSLQAWRKTTPIFYTATDTVTELANTQWVTDSRMLCSLPKSCLVHSVDRFESRGWFSSVQVIFLTVYRIFGVKPCSIYAKRCNFWFPVSPGSAEALVSWGGKIKHILIAYFLGNIFAKNCRNRTVYVQIIASQNGTFLRQCIALHFGRITPLRV